MSKEMKEILDLLKANEERGKALAPLAETAEQAEIDARAKELDEIAEERKALRQRRSSLRLKREQLQL